MNKKAGLWLDRNKAVIVSIANNIEARRIITSDMEHYILYSTVVPGDGSPENIRDRRFWNHLGEYYDKIVAHIGDAAEIQIFGPEVAKYELQKRLEGEGLAENNFPLAMDVDRGVFVVLWNYGSLSHAKPSANLAEITRCVK